jgi:hypothetical protein
LGQTQSFFDLLLQYQQLPRSRGSGHDIERWVWSNKLPDKFKQAESELLETIRRLG